MSLEVYPITNIINIIVNEFFPYRGFKLIKEYIINDDDIINNMEKFGYVRIDGINEKNPRNRRNYIIMIMLKDDGKNNMDLKKIKKIIDDIDNEEVTKNKILDELFLVINKEFFEKKNFNDSIKELYDRQKNGSDNEGESAFYTICPYHRFVFVVPKCTMIAPHIIMTKEEIHELLITERIQIKDLKIILSNEPIIIWNGGRVGDIVKIIKNSETSLLSVDYRRVENYIH